MYRESSTKTVEITIISGEDLRINKRQPVKKNAFVTVRTDNFNAKTTRMDKDGGSYPTWDEKLVIDIPMHSCNHITVHVQCKTSSGNLKVIGIARIPLTDFCGGFLPENYLHFLSYRLRDDKGDRNGIINLSVRVKTSENSSVTCAAGCSRPWTAGVSVGGYVANGIVTGVPVLHRYQV